MSEFSTNYDVQGVSTGRALVRLIKHNLRKYKSNSNSEKSSSYIDKSLSQENIILRGTENIFEDVQRIYREEFEESVLEYNDKQKRDDRKITSYFDKVANDRNTSVATKVLLQMNNYEYWGKKSFEDKKKSREFFEKQIEFFEEMHPSFRIVSAILHVDESSPHVHIIGIPVSQKTYKTGLKKRVSQRDVFKQEEMTKEHELYTQKSFDLYKKMYDRNATLKQTEHRQRMNDKDFKIYKEREKIKKSFESIIKRNFLGKETISKEDLNNLYRHLQDELNFIARFNAKHFDVKEKKEEYEKKVTVLEEKFTKLLKDLKDKNSSLEKKLVATEEEFKRKLEEKEESYKEQVRQAQARANEQIQAIEEQLEIERELNQSLKKENEELENTNKRLESRNKSLTSSNVSLEIAIRNNEEKKKRTEEFLKKHNLKNSLELERFIEESTKKQVELKEKNKDLEKKSKSLELEINSQEEKRRTVDLEIEELRAEKILLEESKEEFGKNVNALAQAKTRIRKNNVFIKKIEKILGEETVKELIKAANEEWLNEMASHKKTVNRNKYRGR